MKKPTYYDEGNLGQSPPSSALKASRARHSPFLSRRSFLLKSALATAAGTLVQLTAVLNNRGELEAANAVPPDLIDDTLNGLIAFVVPGQDDFSAAQGLTTLEPGGIAANITDVLIKTLDRAQPAPPPFPSLSIMVSMILNEVAQGVNPSVSGPFLSQFANLSFLKKMEAFGYLESGMNPELAPVAPLAGLLFIVVTLLVYSEAGVFDPQARKLTGWPVGWTITGYGGVVRGQDDFKGYFQNRRKVENTWDKADGGDKGGIHA